MLTRSTAPAYQCLAALSVILDQANGLAEDKSLLASAFAYELARASGLQPSEAVAALLAALLRHLGCTAFASAEAEITPDDIALRSRLIHADTSRLGPLLGAVTGGPGGIAQRGVSLLEFAIRAPMLRAAWTQEACGAARTLAEGLRLGPGVTVALDEVFERWDGRGAPHGRGGEDLSLAGRVAQVAHVAVVFWLAGGIALAQEILRERAGGALDPALCRRASELLGGLGERGADFLASQAPAVEAAVECALLEASVLDVAMAFGDFADLQLPSARGHSRRVAALATAAAGALGLPAAEVEALALAAHLHDVGQVAVPTPIWMTPRTFRPTEQERARSHVYFTERALASAPPFSAVAPIAAAHHERLDGQGYHRGLAQPSLGRAARILAVADVAAALGEDRPHRPARAEAGVGAELRAMAKAGALDPEAVEAVLGAMGLRAAPIGPMKLLSPRELEVLRRLALGKTNKEIAHDLGISDRTVQHHTIHIYQKLEVDTRAAAALLAARNGLL